MGEFLPPCLNSLSSLRLMASPDRAIKEKKVLLSAKDLALPYSKDQKKSPGTARVSWEILERFFFFKKDISGSLIGLSFKSDCHPCRPLALKLLTLLSASFLSARWLKP